MVEGLSVPYGALHLEQSDDDLRADVAVAIKRGQNVNPAVVMAELFAKGAKAINLKPVDMEKLLELGINEIARTAEILDS